MRIVVAALVASVSSAALAAPLPVRPGIVYCGDGLDLSAEGIGGEDFFCEAAAPADPDGSVLLNCEHSEPEYGDPWSMPATVVENVRAGTVDYVSPDGPITLERCE